jgi:hypothetical protein
MEKLAGQFKNLVQLEEQAKKELISNCLQSGNIDFLTDKKKPSKKCQQAQKTYDKAQKQALLEQLNDYAMGLSGAGNDNDDDLNNNEIFDDGDQTPVIGPFESQKLQSLWSSGKKKKK